ncbi:MAG: hypothetical protein KAT65_11560 [Methanophagales archaeon]|nr:hypothetical protein [Methanophagales archaeon]
MKEGKKIVGKMALVLALCDCVFGGRCGGKACRCNKKDENREEGVGLDDGMEG